jgi:hypothetical protein
MTEEPDITPIEDDQPDPAEEPNPVLNEGDDDVSDDDVMEPTNLPPKSFEADPDDTAGRDDHPQTS